MNDEIEMVVKGALRLPGTGGAGLCITPNGVQKMSERGTFGSSVIKTMGEI
jgi:hypothetical protein